MRIRASAAAAAVAALLLAAPACHRPRARGAETIEEKGKPASIIRMGDASRAGQLVDGFYGVEANAWRWTARQFSVNLRPPLGAKDKGATVEVRLTIPDTNLAALGAQTLSATVGGMALPGETYSKPGDYVYRRYVPANLLTGDLVRIDFQVDKAVPPGDVDRRELGIVATRIGLVAR